jgi:hypothetical protein
MFIKFTAGVNIIITFFFVTTKSVKLFFLLNLLQNKLS